MVRTLVWVLAGVVAYSLAAMALQRRGVFPGFVRIQGPITTIHTKRGRELLDRLSRPRRFWRAWANFGVGVAVVVMVGSFLAVLGSAYTALTQPTRSAIREPQNVLVIPGVNEFLPLAAAPEIVFGLLVGLVVHEGGHGLLCRVEDIDIDSMGLALITVVPVGAFVEPNDESRERADRGGQTRMFAAGVTNNFAVTLVAFALLFGPIAGSIGLVAGVPVGDALPGSPAADAGIGRGDIITAVDGHPVTDESALDEALATADRRVQVSLDDGGSVTVERSLLVARAVVDGPTGLDVDATVTAVNGTPVYTERGLREALENRTVATLRTADGRETTAPMGAYASAVTEGGPLAAAGAPAGRPAVITRFDGERIVSAADLLSALEDTRQGQTATVEAYVGDERRVYEVTMGAHPTEDHGLVGIRGVQPGVSGLVVTDFGVRPYPAARYLEILGGGEDDFLGGLVAGPFFRRMFLVLFLPFASVTVPGAAYNFAGFLGYVTNFYTVRGPLAFLGGWVFTLANLAFWTGWINLNLGFFNCIPAFPLDGGHILRTSTEAVVARLPVTGRRELTTAVTTAVSVTMLVGLVVMLFGPEFVP